MFKIRKFREKDTKEIIKVITTALSELHKCRKEDLGQELTNDLSYIRKNYIENGGCFFVGEYNGKIVGTAAILPENGDVARLKRVYLYKSYRGRGFGSRLCECAEKWCKNKGYNKIVLSTNPLFKDAIRLYEKKGYKLIKKEAWKLTYAKDI